MKIKNFKLLIKTILKGYRGEWETYCNNCGICCYEKVEKETGVIIIDFNSPCPYLDEENKNCSVYNNRFKECPNCSKLKIKHALFARWLPPGCGYVKKFRK